MNKRSFTTLFAAAAAFTALSALRPAPAAAEEAGTVNIESNEMEIIDADKRAIFRGRVVATRSGDTIKADTMDVSYVEVKQADGSMKSEVDTMDCTGGVTIVTGTQTITGDRALFKVRQNVLSVTGHVTVVQGKTVLRGPALEANLRTKHTVMKGRVSGTFVPK
ncbi:MAG: LptA/OstA family protein [Hyphomicrobiales bacterium]